MKKTRTIIFMGLLTALNVVLSRFLSFQTPVLRVGFSFIPVAVSSILFGPVWGGVGAAAADVIGTFLFSAGGYFPGITLSAFLSGAIYGLVLYKRKLTLVRVLVSVALSALLIDAGLNTVWLFIIIPGKTLTALFITRLIKSLIMIPIQVFFIYTIGRLLKNLKLFPDR